MTTTSFETDLLPRHWIQLPASDAAAAAELRKLLGVDFPAAKGRVWQTDDFIYLPAVVNFRLGDVIAREALMFALGEHFVVTLQPEERFAPFDEAIAKMRRTPGLTGSSYGVMYVLLWALNEAAERVVDYASDALDVLADEIKVAIEGHDNSGREIGVMNISGIMARMDRAEDAVSCTQESQLLLARAARHLIAETPGYTSDLDDLIRILIADIDGVKQHASFEHDKVRYLQQSLMTWIDVEQKRW